jgi:hypothetical protein
LKAYNHTKKELKNVTNPYNFLKWELARTSSLKSSLSTTSNTFENLLSRS